METGRDQVGRPPKTGYPQVCEDGKKELEGRTRGEFKVKTEKVPFGGFRGAGGAEPANIAKKNRAERTGRQLSHSPGGVSAGANACSRAGGWAGEGPHLCEAPALGHSASGNRPLKGSAALEDT